MNSRQKHNSRPGRSSSWCRPTTRLAIYLRDGLACVWCGRRVEDGVSFHLDHLRPRCTGGGNDPTNLVTACSTCNASRQDRGITEFARVVADYLHASAEEIVSHVTRTRRRALPRKEARELLARRGTVRAAIGA
jgi:5-methylcytosine-specific restriction endonuclease McrA